MWYVVVEESLQSTYYRIKADSADEAIEAFEAMRIDDNLPPVHCVEHDLREVSAEPDPNQADVFGGEA